MKAKAWKIKAHNAIVLATKQVATPPELKTVRDSITLFQEYILEMPVPAHHLPWHFAIATGKNNSALLLVAGQSLRIAAPRGSAKTTSLSVAIAWIIGHNPGIRIVLVSYSKDIALAISVSIKRIIDSDRFRNIFPKTVPSDRWADGNWFIDRVLAGESRFIKDPTVLAVGAGGSIASRRSDLIVIDDPIKSSISIANPKVRADMLVWWGEVLKPTLVPDGRTIVLCTRYRVDDIHGTTFTVENNWQVITQKAIVNDASDGTERSYWSEYVSLDKLRAIREENLQTFASQYQNEPLSAENMVVKPEWIKRSHFMEQADNLVIGIDLAASIKETADYTAIVVAGKHGRSVDVKFCIRGRWTIHQTINELINLIERSEVPRITLVVEAVAYQVAFANEFKRVKNDLMLPVKIIEFKPRGDKQQRLQGMSGFIESGVISFDPSANLGILISEMLEFPNGRNDDLVDAFVMATSQCLAARKPLSGGKY